VLRRGLRKHDRDMAHPPLHENKKGRRPEWDLHERGWVLIGDDVRWRRMGRLQQQSVFVSIYQREAGGGG
jgi:hypothetical protein